MSTPANDLNITQTGLVVFNGISTFTGVTLTGGTGISITNGNGVAGNPTISASGAVGQTITGNSGSPLQPTLGNWNIVGGVNFTTSGSVSTLTGRSDILTLTTPGSYPYTLLSTDYYIAVDTSSARSIILPAAPSTGKSFVIKDVVGSASSNNITVTVTGGVITIDGLTSQTMSTNYSSITVVFNGSNYFII